MSDDNVKVLVRCRPFNQREGNEGAFCVVKIDKRMGQVSVQQPVSKDITGKQSETRQSHTFTFDAAYGYSEQTKQWSTQTEVFDETCRPAVEFVLKGFNSTIFAYGQTGSGKTYTMMGYGADAGVIPQAIQRIFDYIETAQDDLTYLIKTSFFEIYNEEIRDLMTGKENLPLHEHPQHGVYIKDLSEYLVSSDREITELMERGNKHRSVAATAMNATSSRSHSIFEIIVESCENDDEIKTGKLNLVDLAGSERESKTEATGDRLKEGAKINLSLSTLGIVISKLVDNDPHIPYRQSKLTHLLKDSLGGNSKTLMVVAISPASTNYDETMSTLRYADRAKRIKNKPKINEDPKDAQIRAMRDQIAKLEAQLAQVLAGAPKDATGQAEEAAAILNIQQQLSKIRVVRKQRVKKSPEELAAMQEEQQKLLETLQKKEQKSEKARALVEKFAQQIEDQRRNLAQQRKEELENQQAEQERELRITRQKLAEQKVAEQELTRKLIEQKENQNMEATQFSNIEEEIAILKLKIDKYKEKLLVSQDEFAQVQAENANQKQAKTDDLERVRVEIDAKQTIMDWFIPKALENQLADRCSYDENTGEWRLAGAAAAGNVRRGYFAL